MCSREKKWLLYSIDQEQSKKARPVRYLFQSWIWRYPRLYQPTYVSPPSIGTSSCHLDSLTWFVRWEMRNERRILLLGIRSCSVSPLFAENGEMNWSIHRILGRDWRGSNPQLPPWQGGALTDWTTIPGKLGVQPSHFFSHWISFEPFSSAVL